MKKFYFLHRIGVLIPLFFCLHVYFGQTKSAVSPLEKAPSKIDAKPVNSQKDKSTIVKKGVAKSEGKPMAGSREKTTVRANTMDAKSVKNSLSIRDGVQQNTSPSKIVANGQITATEATVARHQDSRGTVAQLVDDPLRDDVSPLERIRGKVEDVSLRDASSKHYKNADGSYTAIIGAVPLHYKNNGKWQDIDTKITKTTSGEYAYANITNLMESYFGSSAHQGILSKTKEGAVKEFLNTKMYWEVDGKEVGTVFSSNTDINIKGNTAFYNNLYGDISAEFLIETGQRKLNYIISNREALGNIPSNASFLVFSEDIVLPSGWAHNVTAKGIFIKDSNGKQVYLYKNPISSDMAKDTEEENTIFETLVNTGILTIKTKVHAAWLLNNERQFPVKVDPQVTVYPDNTAWWTGETRFNGNESSGDLIVGRRNNNSNYGAGFARFNLSTIPIGATINSVIGYINRFGQTGTITAGSTWQFRNSGDPLTTFGIYATMTTALSTSVGNLGTNGIKSNTFNATGIAYVQNAIANGFVAVGVYPTGTWNGSSYVGFDGYQYTTCPSLLIDYTPPACFAPTNLNVDTITSTSARFTWNAASPAPSAGYQYFLNTTGTAPVGTTLPSGSVVAGVTNATHSGLSPNTVYHFWVRSNCSSSVSSWVYGGYFNTNPSQACFQGDGQVRGPVEDGLDVQMTGIYRVADDFIVPAGETFSLSHISLEALSATAITGVTINVRANNGGSPGAILNTVWSNVAPTASQQYTTAFGFNVYHLTFNLPTPVTYPAGTYWLEVTMRNSGNTAVYWRATSSGTTGAVSQNSGNGGATWSQNIDGYDMMFYVAGTCTTCAPVTISASKNLVCANETVTLTASSTDASYTYHWYLGWDESTQTYQTDLGTGATKNPTVAQSTTYWVVATSPSGCRKYTYVTVAVTPAPTLIVMDPVNAITCSNEVSQVSVVSGGIIPTTILSETFNPLANPWINHYEVTGTYPDAARWYLYDDGDTNLNGNEVFHSNDNSAFAMVDSDFSGVFNTEMESSLVSPPMSFLDYNSAGSNITFTFYHYFRQFISPDSDAYVEITTDGVNWTTLRHYTSTVGARNNFALETINLNAYKGLPYIQIRFRYHAYWEWYWAIDNINITGTNPLPTTITWAPTAGLWRDAAKTVAYDGAHATTLYASPALTTNYTISAKTAVGCPATATVTVERGDKNWGGVNQDWNTGSNWSEGTIPTANHCVIIPNTSQKPIINVGTNAFAKNLTVQPNGNLTIAGNLTVTDYVRNEGATDNLTVASDGNLIQINPAAPNTGTLNAERFVTDMDNVVGTQMDYVYWSAPVTGQQTKGLSGFSPGTPPDRFFRYNEPNDRFYETGDLTFVPAKGYAVQAETSQGFPPNPTGYSKTYHFRGTPNNGDVSINIQRSPDGAGGLQHGFNLVGNPYPSNIDFNVLYANNSALIFNTVYFWTNNTYTQSQQGSNYAGNNYAVYNGTGGNPPTGGSYGTAPNGIIKVGQGVIVQKRTIGGPAPLLFRNSYGAGQNLRVTNSGTFYQRGENAVNRFWIKLISPSNVTNTQLIAYIPDASNGYDADYDAQILGMSSDVFYSKVEDKQLLIQGKSNFIVTDKVPLGANFFKTDIYTIALEATEGIFAGGQHIYLKDIATGVVTDLTQGPYSFQATKGVSEGRFEIIYEPESILAAGGNVKEGLVVYRDGTTFVVKAPTKEITKLELYDASGRLIAAQLPHNTRAVVNAETLNEGMYILRIHQGDTITVRKVRK